MIFYNKTIKLIRSMTSIFLAIIIAILLNYRIDKLTLNSEKVNLLLKIIIELYLAIIMIKNKKIIHYHNHPML